MKGVLSLPRPTLFISMKLIPQFAESIIEQEGVWGVIRIFKGKESWMGDERGPLLFWGRNERGVPAETLARLLATVMVEQFNYRYRFKAARWKDQKVHHAGHLDGDKTVLDAIQNIEFGRTAHIKQI